MCNTCTCMYTCTCTCTYGYCFQYYLPGEKGPIKTGDMDLTSESAVKIQHSLGDLFDDSDEEEMHTVRERERERERNL